MSVRPLLIILAGIGLVGAALPALHAEPSAPPPAAGPVPGSPPLQPSAAGTIRDLHPWPFRCVRGGRCTNHRLVVYYLNCRVHITTWRC
jgi:hypothetical protein